MIDTSPYQHCECLRMANGHDVCQGELTLQEKGKKVTLSLRASEEAKAVVLDGCMFRDNDLKCDALFLFKGNNRKVVALVELKGAGYISHAYEQLAYTRYNRSEYRHLKQNLDQSGPGQLKEMAFIVTNGMLSKPEREKLEDRYGLRVNEVLKSEPTSKIPDLRVYF
jgi:hypothetical protein